MKNLIDNLLRDLRYAFRSLRKDRRLALLAIFALALGIGATTVVCLAKTQSAFKMSDIRGGPCNMLHG